METIAEKNCKKCGKVRPLDKYPKSSRTRDGRAGKCYSCCHQSRYYTDLNSSRANARKTAIRYRKVRRNLYLENKANQSAKYHAARRSLTDTLTVHEWQLIKAFYNESCAYCGEDSKALFRVRIIPVSKGGEFTAQNVAPACPSCSASKKDRSFRPLLMHDIGEETAPLEDTQGADKMRVLPGEFLGTGNVAPQPVASYI